LKHPHSLLNAVTSYWGLASRYRRLIFDKLCTSGDCISSDKAESPLTSRFFLQAAVDAGGVTTVAVAEGHQRGEICGVDVMAFVIPTSAVWRGKKKK